MKFASFIHKGDQTYGQVKETGNGFLLSDMGLELGGSLLDWIESDQMDDLKEQTEHFECNILSTDVKLLPPVLGGEKIVCIGVNYAKRNAEYKDNSDLPKYPSVFLRYADSFVGHDDNMLRPPESDKLDYE